MGKPLCMPIWTFFGENLLFTYIVLGYLNTTCSYFSFQISPWKDIWAFLTKSRQKILLDDFLKVSLFT